MPGKLLRYFTPTEASGDESDQWHSYIVFSDGDRAPGFSIRKLQSEDLGYFHSEDDAIKYLRERHHGLTETEQDLDWPLGLND